MILKFTKGKFCLTLLFALIFDSACAQLPDLRLVSSASLTISNTTHSVDFAVGETVASNFINNINLFTIGFLQPLVSQAPAPLPNGSNFIVLYPVPAVNQISYFINDPDFIPTTGQILSMSGSILQSKTIAAGLQTGQVFTFNITGLSSGNYRIRFFNSLGNIRVGKFIKF